MLIFVLVLLVIGPYVCFPHFNLFVDHCIARGEEVLHFYLLVLFGVELAHFRRTHLYRLAQQLLQLETAPLLFLQGFDLQNKICVGLVLIVDRFVKELLVLNRIELTIGLKSFLLLYRQRRFLARQ